MNLVLMLIKAGENTIVMIEISSVFVGTLHLPFQNGKAYKLSQIFQKSIKK